MNERQAGDVAEAAFQARFGDVEVVRANVRGGFHHEAAPVVDVNVICDGKYERSKGGGSFDARRESIDEAWREAEDSPGCPMVHFIPKPEIGRRDPRCTPGRRRLAGAGSRVERR